MTTWEPGAPLTLPGTYIRITNRGEPQPAGTIQGIVGAVLRATWGPLAAAATVESLAEVDRLYGTGLGTDLAREAIRGGARSVVVVRPGTGGAAASLTLNDGVAAPIGTAAAEYVGTRGANLRLTLRTSLIDATKKEALIYELVDGALVLRRTITFPKAGGDEMLALADAADDVDAGERWITFTKTAVGNGVLADVTQVALSTVAGADPTVDAAAYSAALDLLTSETWNVAALDTNDTVVHASARVWIDSLHDDGLRRFLVLGEPTSVALATRQTNSRAFNDPPVLYALNGFSDANGDHDGWAAAGRVAGMVAAAPLTGALNHATVSGATGVVGALGRSDQIVSVDAGAIVFGTGPAGEVWITKGVTTFQTPTADLDAGWKSVRRARQRYELLNRIYASWEPLIAQDIPNNPDGRSKLIGVADGVIDLMTVQGALDQGGRIYVDPANPPAGNTATFVLEVDDLDSIAVMRLTAAFRFAAPAAA